LGGKKNLLSSGSIFWEGQENYFPAAQFFGRDKKFTFQRLYFLGETRKLFSKGFIFWERQESYFPETSFFRREEKNYALVGHLFKYYQKYFRFEVV
jgi:hypothetical protein